MAEPFIITHRVIFADTDAAGVVYNGNYLRFFESGRTEFLRERINPGKTFTESGLMLVVSESWLRYKAPARYDDLLEIETFLTSLTPVKTRFSYRIVRQDGPKRRLLVKGYTDLAPVNREGRLIRLPEELFLKMAPFAEEVRG